MRRLAGMLLAALVSAAPLMAADEGLVVRVDQPLGTVSPYVLGANCGILCAVPVSMFDAARQSGVTLLRYGGGFSDERELTSSNIDTFMATVRMIGAEPLITVRLHNSTPEASAEDVRYANIERGYNVRYWSIGNEPTLFASLFRTEYDAERHSREWRAHAEAMLAVDPSIILVGPDLHQYPGMPELNPRDAAGRDWMETFLASQRRSDRDCVDSPLPVPAQPGQPLCQPRRSAPQLARVGRAHHPPPARCDTSDHWP
jgi:hypothetical protein